MQHGFQHVALGSQLLLFFNNGSDFPLISSSHFTVPATHSLVTTETLIRLAEPLLSSAERHISQPLFPTTLSAIVMENKR